MDNSRRSFIKISALGAGGMALTSSTLSPLSINFSEEDRKKLEKQLKNLKRTPTYCEVCFWKCSGWAYTDEKNNVIKIIGNEDDPHCNGRLCPRGTGGVGMYADDDRLKKPLIRTKVEGQEDTFREAT
ncbi:MAG: twin-arginine translocation signal domain-containing protein, partial [Flavobacteriaceae bacterium]|nr:twin-arginine translocation signal domain-containing protein [Flavobacteriaceae bacterium]